MCPLFFSDFNETLTFSTDFRKILKHPSSGSRIVPCEWKDRRSDMTKLIVAFRNFANAPKHENVQYKSFYCRVWLDRNTLIESCGRQWQCECYESLKEMEEAPTSFTHIYMTHCRGLQQNDTHYDIRIPIIFPLSSPCLSLRDSVLHFAFQLFSSGIMRQDVTFRSETRKVLFTNILASFGDVINMQTQRLIPIIRRK